MPAIAYHRDYAADACPPRLFRPSSNTATPQRGQTSAPPISCDQASPPPGCFAAKLRGRRTCRGRAVLRDVLRKTATIGAPRAGLPAIVDYLYD